MAGQPVSSCCIPCWLRLSIWKIERFPFTQFLPKHTGFPALQTCQVQRSVSEHDARTLNAASCSGARRIAVLTMSIKRPAPGGELRLVVEALPDLRHQRPHKHLRCDVAHHIPHLQAGSFSAQHSPALRRALDVINRCKVQKICKNRRCVPWCARRQPACPSGAMPTPQASPQQLQLLAHRAGLRSRCHHMHRSIR